MYTYCKQCIIITMVININIRIIASILKAYIIVAIFSVNTFLIITNK